MRAYDAGPQNSDSMPRFFKVEPPSCKLRLILFQLRLVRRQYRAAWLATLPHCTGTVHCLALPVDGAGKSRRTCENITGTYPTVSPPSLSCIPPQLQPSGFSLPLHHVIAFNDVLPTIQLRNPLRESLDQVYQAHRTRSLQPPTGCRHR